MLSTAEPELFSERGLTIARQLASETVLGEDEYSTPDTRMFFYDDFDEHWIPARPESADSLWIERYSLEWNSRRSRLLWKYLEFASGFRNATLDEVIEAWNRAHPSAPA